MIRSTGATRPSEFGAERPYGLPEGRLQAPSERYPLPQDSVIRDAGFDARHAAAHRLRRAAVWLLPAQAQADELVSNLDQTTEPAPAASVISPSTRRTSPFRQAVIELVASGAYTPDLKAISPSMSGVARSPRTATMDKLASASNRFYGTPVSPYSKPSEFYMTKKFTSLITVSVALAVVFTLGGSEAMAACTPEIWPNTDTPYITVCDDDEDIHIDLNDEDITATVNGIRGSGIVGISEGDPSGDVTINVQGGSIKTSGRNSHGIQGWSLNGDVTINVQGVSITTDSTTHINQNFPASGIHAVINDPKADNPDGKISITAKDVTIMTSGGRRSNGVYGYNASKKTDNPDTETDIDIDIQDSSITTEGSLANGILGDHRGDGDVNIDVRGSNITSGGYHGIYGLRKLLGDRADITGDINIDIQDSSITTKAYPGHGIYAKNEGITRTIHDFNVDDYVSNVVSGYATGDINIDVQGVTITTESTDVDPDTLRTESHGIYGLHLGKGDIDIDVQDRTMITTKGVNSHGIYGYHEDVLGDGTPGSNGDIDIDVRDSSITTFGQGSHGILAEHDSGMGSIAIDVGGDIHASGTGASGVKVGLVNSSDMVESSAQIEDGYRKQTVTVNGPVMGNEAGVYLAGGGRVVIGPQGSVGAKSGIAILATGDTPVEGGDPIKPKLYLDMNLAGRRVAQVIGNDWIINEGGETTIAVNNIVLHEGDAGVTGRTAPNGAWNVTMLEHGFKLDDYTNSDPSMWTRTQSTDAAPIIEDRDFSAEDFTETPRPRPPRPPTPEPEPGPEPELQVYVVEEPVFGGPDDVAGIYIEGDGIVYIRPMGSIRAESGIAILATQDPSGPLSNSSPEDLLFGDVIGGGVDLRSTGAVSEIATLTTGDGPRLTVDMDLDGRRVQDVIGDDWIINDQGETTIIVNGVTLHEGATGIVTDAVAPNGPFNVAMTGEGVMVTDRTDPDPANWIISDPTLGVIADRDFSAEDFLYLPTSGGSPMFVEEYAPRAALYEVLPDFMLRMQKWEPTRRLFLPESPVYIRLLGNTGSQEFKHSTVNANYDADRSAVEAGVNIPLFENLDIWASMHHVTGSADVYSPVNGGDIRVTGSGLSVDAYWSGEDDYYATGRLSLTDYDMDLSSNTIGRLKSNGDANGQSVHVEAGRRMTLSENLHWTPRAWLGHTRISVDKFTDAVDSRVSFSNTDRFTGGLGVMAESVRAEYGGGELLLRGSLDFEQKFGDSRTVTLVSGERLSAEPEKSSALLSLSGAWNKGSFTYSAELSARQDFNSGGEDYSGVIHVGMNF